MEIKELDIKNASIYQLLSWNKYCFDLSKIIYWEVKQREAKVRTLNLGYGEGIDAISMPIGLNLNPCAELFFALKLPY